MRLIDADAVIKKQRGIMESLYGGSAKVLKEHMDIDDDLSVPMHGLENYARAKQFYYGLKGVLEAAQTASATPVVYCKDCEHAYESFGRLVCSHSIYTECTVREDFFCADGVTRKENER